MHLLIKTLPLLFIFVTIQIQAQLTQNWQINDEGGLTTVLVPKENNQIIKKTHELKLFDTNGNLLIDNMETIPEYTDTSDYGNIFPSILMNDGSIMIATERVSGNGSTFMFMKYDSLLNMEWMRFFNGEQYGTIRSFKKDSNEDLYVVTSKSGNAALHKFDNETNHLWSYKINGNAAFSYAISTIDIDTENNIIIYESKYDNTLEFSTKKVTKLDINGNIIWNKIDNNWEADIIFTRDLLIDNNNDIYVVSWLDLGNLETFDILINKFDGETGDYLWTQQYNNDSDIHLDCKLDDDGNLYLFCVIEEETGIPANPHPATVLLKYDSSGNLLWEQEYAEPVYLTNFIGCINHGICNDVNMTFNPDGDLYLTGRHVDSTVFVRKVSPDGEELWKYNFVESDSLQWTTLQTVADNQGHLYYSALTESNDNVIVQFTDETASTVSSVDLVEDKEVMFMVCPNPFNEQLSFAVLSDKMGAATIQLVDVKGNVVYKEDIANFPNQNHTISTNQLPTGVYYLQYVDKDGKHVEKVVKVD